MMGLDDTSAPSPPQAAGATNSTQGDLVKFAPMAQRVPVHRTELGGDADPREERSREARSLRWRRSSSSVRYSLWQSGEQNSRQ
jgi:hypothetical protein